MSSWEPCNFCSEYSFVKQITYKLFEVVVSQDSFCMRRMDCFNDKYSYFNKSIETVNVNFVY